MPTENNPVPFKREERYITLKLNRLAKDEAEYLRDCQSKAIVECVVVESDWPEYHLVWLMLEHRMAGKPVPDFNAVRHADSLQQRLSAAEQRNAELVSAVRSINRGKHHEIFAPGDDEPQYMQRKQWVDWVLSICDEVSALNLAELGASE